MTRIGFFEGADDNSVRLIRNALEVLNASNWRYHPIAVKEPGYDQDRMLTCVDLLYPTFYLPEYAIAVDYLMCGFDDKPNDPPGFWTDIRGLWDERMLAYAGIGLPVIELTPDELTQDLPSYIANRIEWVQRKRIEYIQSRLRDVNIIVRNYPDQDQTISVA